MADKSIFELDLQTSFSPNDRLVVGNYANSDAEAITGQKLIQLLGEELDAHGGVTSVTLASTSGLTKTYHINYVDGSYDTLAIADGDYISSYAIGYQASASGTTPPTGTWSPTPVTATDAAPYLWTRITLSKAGGGSDVVVYSVGYKGHDAPTIESQSVAYQLGESGTEHPTGTWSSTIPSPTDTYPYLWTQTIVAYSDNSRTEAYSVAPSSRLAVGTVTATALETGQSATATITNSQSGVMNTLNFAFGLPKGAKGDTGDYIEPVITYGTSTNPAVEPTNWYADASSLSYASGNYIWRKTEYTLHDAQTVQMTKKEIIGYIGQNGSGSGTVTQVTFNNVAHQDDGTGNVSITVDAGDVGAIADPSTKSNGQVLTYDSTSGEWVAANPSTGNVNTVNSVGVTPGTTNIVLSATNIPTSDSDSVQSHITSIESDVSGLGTDISGLQSDMSSAQGDIADLKADILLSGVKTINSGGTKNYTLTGLTADHVVGNWGMFSDSACTTPIPENSPTCDITVTTGNGTWTAVIENFGSNSTFYWKPTFIKG